MLDNPLVSIVVTTYNKGPFLDEALESILKQSYQNWECMIVNDGSTDSSEEVAKRWVEKDKRFKYFYQNNTGVSAARNLGVKQSAGAFIQLLDGDDLLEPHKLRRQVDFMKQHPRVDILFGTSRYFIDGKPDELYLLHPGGDVPTIEVHYNDTNQTAALLYRNFATISATLYRNTVFQKHQFKDLVFEDWFFHLECSLGKQIFHFERIDGTATLIRVADNSQMQRHKAIHSRSPETFSLEVKKMLERYNYKMPYPMVTIDKVSKWKLLLKLWVPPIVLHAVRSIKNN